MLPRQRHGQRARASRPPRCCRASARASCRDTAGATVLLSLARGYTFARRVLLIRKQRRRHQQVSLPSYRYLRHPPSTSQLKRATHRRTTEWASIWAVLQCGGGPISLTTGDFAHTAFTGARGEAGRSRGVPQGRSGHLHEQFILSSSRFFHVSYNNNNKWWYQRFRGWSSAKKLGLGT